MAPKATIMGVDPGLRSLGICVLEDDRVTHIFQAETKKSQRTKVPMAADIEKWYRVLKNALNEARPVVVGLEDIEHQPWRTQGRIPSHIMQLHEVVRTMDDICKQYGAEVYRQSPGIQADYPDEVVEKMVRVGMGEKIGDIQSHLVSAGKHALHAQAQYARIRRMRHDQ